MSHTEFNDRAKYVYTQLLPLLQTATAGDVVGLTYEACGDDEDIVVLYADGSTQRVCVSGSSLCNMASEVLRKVS